MPPISTHDQLPSLVALARAHPIELEDIIAVPDVRQWKLEHGLQEANSMRAATVVRLQTGPWLIVLAEQVTDGMRRAVVGGMLARGFFEEVDALEHPVSFLQHLVLHEVSHALHPEGDESFHDEWAFEQLPKPL